VLDRAQTAADVGLTPDARTGWLYSLGGVITAVGLYSLLHITARLFASFNLGEDDPLDAILTQTLALGYQPEQPPLYDWAIWLLGEILGPGALRFQLLKYTLLTATCGFIFLSARRVMKGDAFWAFLSVEALALIYQISWRFHEGFTHAVGAMCAVAAGFWAMLRLIERRRTADFAVFGMVIGLGVMTVTTYWVYLAALIGATCLQGATRRALLQPRLLLSLAIAALIAGPHFLWLASTPDGFSAILPSAPADPAQHLRQAIGGVRRAFTEPVMYLAPLIFIYPLFFPGMLPAIRRRTRLAPVPGAAPDYEQLILHLTLLSIAALIAGAVLFGIEHYPVHALMPLFLVTSIWLTAQARSALPPAGQVRRFVIAALGIAVFAFCARCANMYVQEPVCQICRWGVPYAELAADIKAQGFDSGRIIVDDKEVGGNLHRFFPQASITLVGGRPYSPDSGAVPGKTAIVWPDAHADATVAAQVQSVLPRITPADLAAASTISIPWRHHFWKPDGYRVSSWKLLILPKP
jgi:Dolichyl-phosphate-mannose-protein mannosyltransferase